VVVQEQDKLIQVIRKIKPEKVEQSKRRARAFMPFRVRNFSPREIRRCAQRKPASFLLLSSQPTCGRSSLQTWG